MNIKETFESVTPFRASLDEMARSLRMRPGILSVHADLALQQYESGPSIEAYIEAELADGNAIVWWLDIYLKGNQAIFEPRIMLNDASGGHTLQELPVRSAVDRAGIWQVFLSVLTEARSIRSYLPHVSSSPLPSRVMEKYAGSPARSVSIGAPATRPAMPGVATRQQRGHLLFAASNRTCIAA